MAGKKRAAKKVAGALRDRRCVELRVEGYTLQEIAEQVGLKTPSAVHKAIQRTIAKKGKHAVDELRAIELERLDRIQRKLWEKFNRKDLKLGDMLQITRALLKLSSRRARVEGTDAPVKHQVEAGVEARVDARLRDASAEMTNEELIQTLLEDPGLREQAMAALTDTNPEGQEVSG